MTLKNKVWCGGKLTDWKFAEDHQWYRMNKDTEVPEILIYDVIGDPWDGTTAKSFIKELNEIEADEILVRINSPGGLVYEGYAIYNALRQYGGTVTTRVDAVAASIASVIFMAGDKREMPEASDLMMHKPWSCVCGDADDMRTEADELDRVQNMIEEIYEKNSNMSREDVSKMTNSTTWMSGREAHENGYATDLLEDAKIAACMFDLDTLPDVPKRHRKMAEAARKRQEERALREEGLPKRDAKAKVATASRDDGIEAAKDKLIELLNKIGG